MNSGLKTTQTPRTQMIIEIFCENSLKANIHWGNNSYHFVILKSDREKVREQIKTHSYYLVVQFSMTPPQF